MSLANMYYGDVAVRDTDNRGSSWITLHVKTNGRILTRVCAYLPVQRKCVLHREPSYIDTISSFFSVSTVTFHLKIFALHSFAVLCVEIKIKF